ncbi:MAG TPA: DUF2127 domain-containing protein [Candidatus Binatia bacterium]
MKLLRLLRALILGEFLLSVAVSFVDLLFPSLLPPAYREISSETNYQFTVLDWITLVFSLVYLIALIGLWQLKNWARWLYTFVTLAYLPLAPFVSHMLSPTAQALDGLTYMCTVAILILIWVSILNEKFGASTTEAVSTAPRKY